MTDEIDRKIIDNLCKKVDDQKELIENLQAEIKRLKKELDLLSVKMLFY
jgi:archaellum component FlaC